MACPTYADEAVVILTLIDPQQSGVFSSRIIRLDRARDAIPIGRTSNRNHKYRALSDNAWIDSAVMSREHAEIQFDIRERKVFLVDVGSLHGTFANGVRLGIDRKHHIRSGDTLQFGITIEHGNESWHPCNVKADVIFGRLDPAQRPATFTVPDDSDVEEVSNDSHDASVGQSCKTLRTHSINAAFATPAKQQVDIIDLTANDKALIQSSESSLHPYAQPETPVADLDDAEEVLPESRIPTPPETVGKLDDDNMFPSSASDVEDEDAGDGDEDEAFDGDDDEYDFDDDEEIFDYESRESQDASDDEDTSRQPSVASSQGGDHDGYHNPDTRLSPMPVAPALEQAVFGLSITEASSDASPRPRDTPMQEESYTPEYSRARPLSPDSRRFSCFGDTSPHDSSAYQWELSKRIEARKAAFSKVSDNLVKHRLQTPPVLLPVVGVESASRPPKRKATDMSRDDEPGEFGEPLKAMQLKPLADPSPAAQPTASAPSSADVAGDERNPKRYRKVVEALGYAALGGVTVMSVLIATAPTL